MSHEPNQPQHIRRVVLPSGKTIEVISFDEEPEQLHVCGTCHSDLVHPLDWEEAGTRHWQVTLRCPNCEWVGTGVFAQEAMDRFDEELDRGLAQIWKAYDFLVRTHMAEELARFRVALQADAILPEDF